jgi:hypothetical protein
MQFKVSTYHFGNNVQKCRGQRSITKGICTCARIYQIKTPVNSSLPREIVSLCELSNARYFSIGKNCSNKCGNLGLRAGYNCITHTYTAFWRSEAVVCGGGWRHDRLGRVDYYLFNCDLGLPAGGVFWASEWKCCSHADPALTLDRHDVMPFLISTWTQPEEWHTK